MLRLSRIHSSDVAKFIGKSVDEISSWVVFKGSGCSSPLLRQQCSITAQTESLLTFPPQHQGDKWGFQGAYLVPGAKTPEIIRKYQHLKAASEGRAKWLVMPSAQAVVFDASFYWTYGGADFSYYPV
ncbi:hypothetical protein AV530_018854 [Patagioenas fasciata monilis]|uniref:Uncharacterized protein n=1 Tax=Patagioenas fasciata monilis TaxID=372326 RepID=A0A1V4JJR9_PATFA|nr:hypothetical protein AV530_018854 [Patagioenas fasciata monilis]